MSRRIFISAVSKELQSYRKLVSESLRKRGYIPVDQEISNLTDQEIVHLLKDKLAPCDAVVCLIGQRYGAEPSKPLDGFPRRSFTQLEYIFARAMTEPRPRHISLFLTTDQTPSDHPNDEPDELRELQRTYRAEVTRDRNWRAFNDAKELRAEIAELRFPWEQSAEHKPCNLPPSIGTLFKGRDEFLAELRAKLKEAGVRAAAITPRQAIHGLGGVGKTQLAVEFGWRHFDDYNALLYLYAENPSVLLTSLAQLTGVLELPERELREDEKRADAVLRWLNGHRDWLLLIDNVDTDEAAAAVIARLENVHGGHIIITSRLSRWPKLVEPLELDVLTKEPAVAFLLEAAVNRADAGDDAEQAGLIWDDVDGLALALTQAAGYIDKYRISFAAYRKRWQQNVATVAAWHDPRTMTYPRSLAVTWNTTVDRLTPPARTLLELLSFLAPEPIPRDLITGETSAKALAAAGIAEEALLDLADVSLARVSGDTATLHRLVMEITRGRIASAYEPEASWTEMPSSLAPPARAMLAIVNAYPLGAGDDVRNWARWIPMAEHVAVLVERADAAGTGKPTSRLMNELGIFLYARIRFAEAERLYRRSLAIDEQSFGPEHHEVAVRLNNLAQLLSDTNRLDEAEPLMRRALAIDERSFGPDHPNVAVRLNNLAKLLHDTNRLSEAETLMRRALAIDEESFGPAHPGVAITLNNLAWLLKAMNRLGEAEPLMRRALAVHEQSFGPEHPIVAIDLNNLAILLHDTNRLGEAEPLMRRALTIDEQSFGTEYPSVARDLGNLAALLKATNRLGEAEPLTRRALAIDEQSFGPDHPNVAIRLNNLADLLNDTNRLGEAEPLMRRALAILLASLGTAHPRTQTAQGNYALLLKKIGLSETEIDAAMRQVLDGAPAQ
jgi:tetratricopeptide (TPR) repeat protein